MSDDDGSTDWGKWLQLALTSGFLTALLFLFGWVYTNNFLRGVGVDNSLLGYGTDDYVLRSVNVVVQPGAFLALWMLVWSVSCIVVVLIVRLVSRRAAQVVLGALFVVGGTVLYAAWESSRLSRLTWSVFEPDDVDAALVWLAGVTAILLVGHLGVAAKPHAFVHPRVKRWTDKFIPSERANAVLVLKAAAVVSIMWGLITVVNEYAQAVAREDIARINAAPDMRPEVVVFSREPLLLDDIGAHVEPIDAAAPGSDTDSSALYRYSGLRMLEAEDGKVLVWACDRNLLQEGVMIITVSENVWINVQPSKRPAGLPVAVPCERSIDHFANLYDTGTPKELELLVQRSTDWIDQHDDVTPYSKGVLADQLRVLRAAAHLKLAAQGDVGADDLVAAATVELEQAHDFCAYIRLGISTRRIADEWFRDLGLTVVPRQC